MKKILSITCMLSIIFSMVLIFNITGSYAAVDTSKKYIALTFDDGPNTGTNQKILDVLKKHNVPATFFVIGKNINDSTGSVIKRMVDEGHQIGCHGYESEWMGKFTLEELYADWDKTVAQIQKYVDYTPSVMRWPSLGLPECWQDFKYPAMGGEGTWDSRTDLTSDEIVSMVRNIVCDGRIVLLHCLGGDAKSDALDVLIPEIKSQGYEFCTIDQLFEKQGQAKVTEPSTGQWKIVSKNTSGTTATTKSTSITTTASTTTTTTSTSKTSQTITSAATNPVNGYPDIAPYNGQNYVVGNIISRFDNDISFSNGSLWTVSSGSGDNAYSGQSVAYNQTTSQDGKLFYFHSSISSQMNYTLDELATELSNSAGFRIWYKGDANTNLRFGNSSGKIYVVELIASINGEWKTVYFDKGSYNDNGVNVYYSNGWDFDGLNSLSSKIYTTGVTVYMDEWHTIKKNSTDTTSAASITSTSMSTTTAPTTKTTTTAPTTKTTTTAPTTKTTTTAPTTKTTTTAPTTKTTTTTTTTVHSIVTTTVSTTQITSTTAKNYSIGDINCDNKVNILDLLVAKRCLAVDSYAQQYSKYADLNGDGKINILDLLIMKKLVATSN